MPAATADAPTPTMPLTFQPFAEMDGDDMKDILADHGSAPPPPTPAEKAADVITPVEEFTLAGLARKAEEEEKKAAAAAKKPVEQDVEQPKPAEAKKDEITADTTDEEINKRLEEEGKGLTRPQLDRLKNANFRDRNARRAEREARAELESVRAEMQKLKETAPDSNATQAVQKQLEAAQAKLAEKEALLAGTNVRETEHFQKEIAIPRAQLTDEFKKFSADYDVPGEDIVALTQLRGKALDTKLEELTLEMPKRGVSRLNDLVDRHALLAEKEADVMKDAKASYDKFMAAKRDEHQAVLAKRASERAEALPKVWEEVSKNAPWLKEQEGDAEWNGRLKEAKDFVNAADDDWLAKQPAAVRVEFAARAGTYPLMAFRLGKIEAENAKLKARLAEYKGVAPDASAGGSRGATPPAEKELPPGGWNPFAKNREG